jgi:tripartite ATP-independent transporter DctP family solute receptor
LLSWGARAPRTEEDTVRKLSRGTFVAGSVALSAIGLPPRAAPAAQVAWKFGHHLAVDHALNVRAVEAFEAIRRETGGRIDIASFPENRLGSDAEMFAQLRSGAIEMVAYPGAFLNAVVPVASIENVAYAFRSRRAVFEAMDGDLGALIREGIQAQGIAVLDHIWENGFRELTCRTKPIRTVADMAGLKLRVSPGRIRLDTFRSLGAQATTMPLRRLYGALKTGMVDAQENPLLNIEAMRYYEVQRYCSLSHHMWTGYWMLVNARAWKGLGNERRAVIAKHLNGAALLLRGDDDRITPAARDLLRRRGMIFNDVDVASFKAKLASSGYYDRWRREFGSRAWAVLEKYSGRLG